MGAWDSLGFFDARDVYRLIGECRDLGSAPDVWPLHAIEGLHRLIGALAVTGGEGRFVGPDRRIVALSAFDSGLDANGRRLMAAFHRDGAVAMDPFLRALWRVPRTLITRTRSQLVADAVYYPSPAFQNYVRPANLGHRLASTHMSADASAMTIFEISRPLGDRDFSEHDVELLDFFHAEIGPLIGRTLVSAAEPSPEMLSPRLRQTLACLLQGDSEKQIAARLGLSRTTTHQYVTSLYRRFGVRSRGQLLAYCLRRAERAEWKRSLAVDPDTEPAPPGCDR
jgi:DNA-binding CsgD family transcriptional regulator